MSKSINLIKPAPVVIATRFGLGVRNIEWFEHRIKLLRAITSSSLANQTSKNFFWFIFIDNEIPEFIKNELIQILSKFDGRGRLLQGVQYNRKEILNLMNEVTPIESSYFISCRLDDDDAIHPSTIEKISFLSTQHMSQKQDANSIAVTFLKGIEWVMYDIANVWRHSSTTHVVDKQMVREYSRPFLGTSCIMVSRKTDRYTFFDISHSNSNLEDGVNNCEVLILDTEEYMWLYSRHKQADSGTVKANDSHILNVDLEWICNYFSLDSKLVKNYLDSAHNFGYLTKKKSMAERVKLQAMLNKTPPGDLAARDLLLKKLEKANADFIGPAHIEPMMKTVNPSGVFFSASDFDLECNFRLVIYDYKDSNYALVKEVCKSDGLHIPAEFFAHQNYKYKVQVFRENRWVDYFKYVPFFFDLIQH